MQKVFVPTLNAYCVLVKPGIIMGNAITAFGGFALAARGNFDFGLFLVMLAGLSSIIASGCALNNYIDRAADLKMLRTQNRPLAQGQISPQGAIAFAIALLLLGTFLLGMFTGFLTMAIALLGFAVYVFFYSFLKYRSTHATLVGSIAGAVPPVVGYCAVSHQLDLGALLLFLMFALWQMPHFYAIAIKRMEEYAAASIPVLPIKKGIYKTKIQMLFYVIAFGISSLLLSVFHFTSLTYTITAAILSLAWILLSLHGFKTTSDTQWARKMFIFSLIAVTTLCAVIPL
jgi:protoheme IX farnesyltransferase